MRNVVVACAVIAMLAGSACRGKATSTGEPNAPQGTAAAAAKQAAAEPAAQPDPAGAAAAEPQHPSAQKAQAAHPSKRVPIARTPADKRSVHSDRLSGRAGPG